MEIIISPKRSGKTHELIRKSHDSGGYILCFSHAEAHRVAKVAEEMNCSIPFPLTIGDCPPRSIRNKNIPVYIDNAEMVLRNLLGVNIDTITLTAE